MQRMGPVNNQPSTQPTQSEQPETLQPKPLHPAIPYLETLFHNDDHIFFQLIHSTSKHKNARGQDVADTKLVPLMTMEQAIRPATIDRLLELESEGWNVYVCMNPFPKGTTRRAEHLITDVLNLYVEDDGENDTLTLVDEDVKAGLAPAPSVLESSPGKHHIVWNFEDSLTPEVAKPLLKALQKRYKCDPAATDLCRVLRMPGFKNLKPKYNPPPATRMLRDGEAFCKLEDFKIPVGLSCVGKPVIPIESEDFQVRYDLFLKAAEEANYDLGETRESNGGFMWLNTCPWASEHTTGNDEAAIMMLADGRLEFNCFHGHCSERGWSDIRKLWRDKVGHDQRFGPPAPSNVLFGKPETKVVASDKRRKLTDLGNAERLIDVFGDDLRYCDETGRWYVWGGVKWEIAGKSGPQKKMQKVVQTIQDEADFIKPVSEDDKEAAKAKGHILVWARKSESSSAISAAIHQARSMPKIQVVVADFDADLYLLNLLNGTLNLKTFEFRAHDKADLMTKLANVNYDPSATCPKFEAFLEKSMPDKDSRRFLQQASGYSLTGSTVEDCLFLGIGAGRNGKGVFLNTLRIILGSYAQTANFNSFTASKNGGGLETRPDIARMEGARLVIASESEQDQRVAEALIKSLTGSDRITARNLYESDREYQPQFKLFFGINHPPNIRGTDEGIWSRIHRIPWNVFIKPSERIKGLKEILINEEASGILNWMIAGLRDYQQNGLVPSAEIRGATAAYRESSNVIERFLDERCTVGKDLRTGSSTLYLAYQTWCKSSGEFYEKGKAFGEDLKKAGFQSRHAENGTVWLGVGLNQPAPDLTYGGKYAQAAG
jgi:P4 family phage/plasmid primase-like protien